MALILTAKHEKRIFWVRAYSYSFLANTNTLPFFLTVRFFQVKVLKPTRFPPSGGPLKRGTFLDFFECMYKKWPSRGGGHIFGNLCMYGPPFYGPAKKKKGGTLLYYFEIFPWIFKIWVRFFVEEKKNRFFLCLKIHKNSKKINLKWQQI